MPIFKGDIDPAHAGQGKHSGRVDTRRLRLAWGRPNGEGLHIFRHTKSYLRRQERIHPPKKTPLS